MKAKTLLTTFALAATAAGCAMPDGYYVTTWEAPRTIGGYTYVEEDARPEVIYHYHNDYYVVRDRYAVLVEPPYGAYTGWVYEAYSLPYAVYTGWDVRWGTPHWMRHKHHDGHRWRENDRRDAGDRYDGHRYDRRPQGRQQGEHRDDRHHDGHPQDQHRGDRRPDGRSNDRPDGRPHDNGLRENGGWGQGRSPNEGRPSPAEEQRMQQQPQQPSQLQQPAQREEHKRFLPPRRYDELQDMSPQGRPQRGDHQQTGWRRFQGHGQGSGQ